MKLIAVTNDEHSVERLVSIISQIKDEVDYIHIREKSKTARQLMELIDLLKQNSVPLEKMVIHDRLDVALLSNIRNIHMPSHGLPISQVRARFPHLRIGCSVHSVEEAKQAEADGADYVLYGHCYETNCKKGIAPNGIERLQIIQQTLEIPVFAIGGITMDRVSQLQQLGTEAIAVMSSIFSAPNPLASAHALSKKCREM